MACQILLWLKMINIIHFLNHFSLALGQENDCYNTNESTLRDMGKYIALNYKNYNTTTPKRITTKSHDCLSILYVSILP